MLPLPWRHQLLLAYLFHSPSRWKTSKNYRGNWRLWTCSKPTWGSSFTLARSWFWKPWLGRCYGILAVAGILQQSFPFFSQLLSPCSALQGKTWNFFFSLYTSVSCCLALLGNILISIWHQQVTKAHLASFLLSVKWGREIPSWLSGNKPD